MEELAGARAAATTSQDLAIRCSPTAPTTNCVVTDARALPLARRFLCGKTLASWNRSGPSRFEAWEGDRPLKSFFTRARLGGRRRRPGALEVHGDPRGKPRRFVDLRTRLRAR
jgi:hypothetical protein